MNPVILDVRLTEEDFYRERHRIVFRAIKKLYERSEPVDAITVSEFLAQQGDARRGRRPRGGLQPRLHRPGPRATPATTRASSSRTRCCGACWRPAHEIQKSVHDREGEPRDLAERAEKLLFNVAHEEQAEDFHVLKEILSREVDRLEELANGTAEVTGHPVGVRRPRPDHRRLSARQPDHPRRPPRHGQVGSGRQHRRARRGEGEAPGRLLLARDVRLRARPAPDRQARPDLQRPAAQGPGQRRATGPRCCASATSSRTARCGSTSPRTSPASTCGRRRAACTLRSTTRATAAWR